MDVLSLNTVSKEEDVLCLHVISGGREKTSFSDSDIMQMQKTLAEFSDNALMDNKWELHIPSSHRNSSVSFPDLQRDTDSILVRALVLQRLA